MGAFWTVLVLSIITILGYTLFEDGGPIWAILSLLQLIGIVLSGGLILADLTLQVFPPSWGIYPLSLWVELIRGIVIYGFAGFFWTGVVIRKFSFKSIKKWPLLMRILTGIYALLIALELVTLVGFTIGFGP